MFTSLISFLKRLINIKTPRKKTQFVPLIDTQHHQATQAAKAMLSYPLKYFAKVENINRLSLILSNDEAALKLVGLIRSKQLQFLKNLDFSGRAQSEFFLIKNVIDNNSQKYVSIQSNLSNRAPAELSKLGVEKLVDQMNINLAETLNGVGVRNDFSEKNNLLTELVETAWLVNHLALYLVGSVSLEQNRDSAFIFRPKSSTQFIPVWFGSVLEQQSLYSGELAIAKLAEGSYKNTLDYSSLQQLHIRVLSLVNQHWKLNSDSIFEKVFIQVSDLVMILIAVYQDHLFRKSITGIDLSSIKNVIKESSKYKSLLTTFKVIKKFQEELPSEDRLFEVKKGGLFLGSTKPIRGLIKQAEHFAKIELGKNWHGNIEKEQLASIHAKLKKYDHIDFIELQLREEHAPLAKEKRLSLDIDFFVRDKRNKKVYAVQLKHVESSSKAGLDLWLEMLANPDSKLGKGVSQLENLSFIINNDTEVQEYLLDNEILESELFQLTPILIHNVGSMDMISVHSNIWLYDILTFEKVLTGRIAISEKYDDMKYQVKNTYQNDIYGLSLDRPVEIIEAYLDDPRFKSLRIFDAPKHVSRRINFDGITIISEGLGI